MSENENKITNNLNDYKVPGPPPLPKKRSHKGTPPTSGLSESDKPAATSSSNNLQVSPPNELVQMLIKMTAAQKKEIEQFALDKNVYVKDLMVDAFIFYKQHHT